MKINNLESPVYIVSVLKDSYMNKWRRIKEFMTDRTDIKDLGD